MGNVYEQHTHGYSLQITKQCQSVSNSIKKCIYLILQPRLLASPWQHRQNKALGQLSNGTILYMIGLSPICKEACLIQGSVQRAFVVCIHTHTHTHTIYTIIPLQPAFFIQQIMTPIKMVQRTCGNFRYCCSIGNEQQLFFYLIID